MKVTTKIGIDKNIRYPKLVGYTDNEIILLLTSQRKGTVIRGNGAHNMGEIGDQWLTDNQVDYTGEVTLSND